MKPTVSTIAGMVIALLAEDSHVSPDELETRLAAGGRELPVDSLLIVEILTKVESAYGVRIQVDAEAARSTRSVMAFARTIHKALPAGEAE
jgi:acyl carrier protein